MQKSLVALFVLVIISHTAIAQDSSGTNKKRDTLALEKKEEELEEVIIKSNRTSRSIRNIPVRVEVIEMEEIDEKSNMRPSNVSMLLHESTGIQVQQTSATSANAGIRIQGLDGRYTQLLKDGFPNYAGFSGGLSILEIPPLDLKQVEIIKGPASTLYGGGAIAGVINFISVEPGKENYSKLLLNQSHIGQSDLAFFTVQRKRNIGLTFLASGNLQRPYDVDDDHFTELPKAKSLALTPKLFFYLKENSILSVSHSFNIAERRGGDLSAVNGKIDNSHPFFEINNSQRHNTNVEWDWKGATSRFTLRQSISFFNRSLELPTYRFKGKQTNAYTDITYLKEYSKHILITGANFIFDDFKEDKSYSLLERNDRNITGGLYIQDTWQAGKKLSFENGLRIDMTDRYGTQLLPRISALYKINSAWSARAGAGMGYKLPTLFTEQTEALYYKYVLPLNNVKAERSYGGTMDINFKKEILEGLDFSFNHLFFYTIITRPLILEGDTATSIYFVNATANTQTLGFETNAKLIYHHDWKLFAGYTFNETKAGYLSGNQFLPLVPRHKLNLALIYERHDFLKVGLEGYRTGKQYLTSGEQTSAFWEFGFMLEKPVKNFSFFINAENFTDTRQSKFKPVVNGSHTAPSFDEIWTHTEGFVVNGGIKLRF